MNRAHQVVTSLVGINLLGGVLGVARLSLCGLLATVLVLVQANPLLLRVVRVTRLVGQGAHRDDADRVGALADICNAYGVDE